MPNTKSCAVTGSPLDHLAFCRSLKTQVTGLVCCQLSATPGTILPALSLAVSPSKRSRVRLFAPTDSARAGSSVSGSDPLLRTSVWVGCSWTPGGITAAVAGTARARNRATAGRRVRTLRVMARDSCGVARGLSGKPGGVDIDVTPEFPRVRMALVPDQPRLHQVGADAVGPHLVRHVGDQDLHRLLHDGIALRPVLHQRLLVVQLVELQVAETGQVLLPDLVAGAQLQDGAAIRVVGGDPQLPKHQLARP